MPKWDPSQYLKFERERLQPALDLFNRIRDIDFSQIYDLGCGTGNITRILRLNWVKAEVVGVDSSDEMLKKAGESDESGIIWVKADLNTWHPKKQPDLLFSNATLHWLDNHETLFPRLMSFIRQGGYLAIQMPNNFREPTHRAILETIRLKDWGLNLEDKYRQIPVLDPSNYHFLLENLSSEIYIWETCYLHVLEGDNPVVQWTKGSVLRPFLQLLAEDLAFEFEKEYSKRILKAYPPEGDKTFLPFKRLFLVAKKE